MKDIERPSPTSARAVRAYATSAEELLEILEETVESLPGWTLESSEGTKLHAVRDSRIFKFKDDVNVGVSNLATGCEAVFESSSRVGKGDMGQNPRNLRRLIGSLNQRLN
ncbi:hypothetical protein BH24ACT20_BH24ACT20_05720 [soil metagenome]|jgi:uncharacterized protein (DUF1499 family)